MPEGPLGGPRLTSLGPFAGPDAPYDDGFEWAVNFELAHFIWNRVEESDYLVWGPEPPLLIEADMDFGFEQNDMNSWFFTREEGKTYGDVLKWGKMPSRFRTDKLDMSMNPTYLMDMDKDPIPESMKIMTQLYTSHGAMMTFDLKQEKGEPASGMVRVPVPEELSQRVMGLDSEQFEYFEYQYRNYSGEWGDVPGGRTEYHHPHFSSGPIYEWETYRDWFERAFNMVERGVKMEGG